MRTIYRISLLLVLLFGGMNDLSAQSPVPGAPVNLTNMPQKDTTNRTNNVNWHDEPVIISFKKAGEETAHYPDTSVHTFHRRPYSQPWNRDLGNLGSATRSLLFTPDNLDKTGPSLGYHVFDAYRIDADSVLYYNTTRPYTSFSYQLGSKLEQNLQVMHTQNIKRNWNFAVAYNKINSQGYYKIQRTIHDNGSLSTNYQSPKQHYQLNAAIVYNLAQHDENGGITADSFLSQSRYVDRRTVPVAFDNTGYSSKRSSVTNRLREFNVLLQHSYTWGRRDTLYNTDSTQYSFELIPRFRISHRMEIGSEKYKFNNVQPDSTTWSSFFQATFATNDSVFTQQQWLWVDNRISLDGFLGKLEKQLLFSAGLGNRVDDFRTRYVTGDNKNNILSNYVFGQIGKDAVKPGQWFYKASLQFFITGSAAGNFKLDAALGKDLGKWGILEAGFKQQLNAAPYNYTLYENQHYTQATPLNNESITQLYATLYSDRLGLSLGIRNYVMSNYIYLTDTLHQVSNGRLLVQQSGAAFNLTQVWGRKAFHFGHFVLDNELAFQQIAGDAPLDVPQLLGRHQLSYENFLFKKALKIATGVEVRYHTGYTPLAYSPFYNRFYYQEGYTVGTEPEASAFFNFKVKRFRAYLMGDQLQRLFGVHNIPTPGYPTQDVMLRFGFNWIMVN